MGQPELIAVGLFRNPQLRVVRNPANSPRPWRKVGSQVIVDDIIRVAGRACAEHLCQACDGRTVFVTANPTENYRLPKIVGHQNAISIAHNLDADRGVRILVPMHGRDGIR